MASDLDIDAGAPTTAPAAPQAVAPASDLDINVSGPPQAPQAPQQPQQPPAWTANTPVPPNVPHVPLGQLAHDVFGGIAHGMQQEDQAAAAAKEQARQNAINQFVRGEAAQHAQEESRNTIGLDPAVGQMIQSDEANRWARTAGQLSSLGIDPRQYWGQYYQARNAYKTAYQDYRMGTDPGLVLSGNETPEQKKLYEDAYAQAKWDMVTRPQLAKQWKATQAGNPAYNGREPDDNDLGYMAATNADVARQLDRQLQSVPGYNTPGVRAALTAGAKGIGKVLNLFARAPGPNGDLLPAAGELLSGARQQSDARQLNGFGQSLSNIGEAVGTIGTQAFLGGQLGIPPSLNFGGDAAITAYHTAKQHGLSDGDAQGYALGEGLVNGLTVGLFPKAWQRLIGGSAEGATTFRQAMIQAVKSLPSEAVQNLGVVSAQTIGSAIAQKLSGIDPDALRGEKLASALGDGLAQAVGGVALHHAIGLAPGAVRATQEAADRSLAESRAERLTVPLSLNPEHVADWVKQNPEAAKTFAETEGRVSRADLKEKTGYDTDSKPTSGPQRQQVRDQVREELAKQPQGEESGKMAMKPPGFIGGEAVGLRDIGGWKLHLAADPANHAALNKALDKMGVWYKEGHGAGQEGKDYTVWVGHKDVADRVAQAIHGEAGHLLAEPHGDVLVDDKQMVGKVWGRFDAAGDNQFHQYGRGGVPYTDQDIKAKHTTEFQGKTFDADSALAKSDRILRRKYGEFYTGTKEQPNATQSGKISENAAEQRQGNDEGRPQPGAELGGGVPEGGAVPREVEQQQGQQVERPAQPVRGTPEYWRAHPEELDRENVRLENARRQRYGLEPLRPDQETDYTRGTRDKANARQLNSPNVASGRTPERQGSAGSAEDYPQRVVHGGAVGFETPRSDLDTGKNRFGPGFYAAEGSDRDIAEHYADRAIRRTRAMFGDDLWRQVTESDESKQAHYADIARQKADAFEKNGNEAEATRYRHAASIVDAIREGRYGHHVGEFEYSPKKVLDLGRENSAGRELAPEEKQALASQFGREGIEATKNLKGAVEVYDALAKVAKETARGTPKGWTGKEAVRQALLNLGYDGLKFVHRGGGVGREYTVHVALNHEDVKPAGKAVTLEEPPARKLEERGGPNKIINDWAQRHGLHADELKDAATVAASVKNQYVKAHNALLEHISKWQSGATQGKLSAWENAGKDPEKMVGDAGFHEALVNAGLADPMADWRDFEDRKRDIIDAIREGKKTLVQPHDEEALRDAVAMMARDKASGGDKGYPESWDFSKPMRPPTYVTGGPPPGPPGPPPGPANQPSQKPPTLFEKLGPINAARTNRDVFQAITANRYEQTAAEERRYWGLSGELGRRTLAGTQRAALDYQAGRPVFNDPVKDGLLDRMNRYMKWLWNETRKYTGSTAGPLERYTRGMWADRDGNVAQVLGNRTLEGSQVFRHMKSFRTEADAQAAGYREVTNFIERNMYTIREMHKYLGANDYLAWAKRPENGMAPFSLTGGKILDGFEKMTDRLGHVHAPNEHEVRIAIDQPMWDGINGAMQALGGRLTQSTNLGRDALGYTRGLEANVRLGDMLTALHELGHVADNRLNLWTELGGRSQNLRADMRALADQRLFPTSTQAQQAEVRQPKEMIANLFYAYLHAPQQFEQTAPVLFRNFEAVMQNHPELHGILDVKPSLQVGEMAAKIKGPGIVNLGFYQIPASMNRYLERLMSPSLNQNLRRAGFAGSMAAAGYQGINSLNGAMNAVNLLGPFHAPQTAFSALFGDLQVGLLRAQRGVKQIAGGQLAEGAGNVAMGLAKGLTTPAAAGAGLAVGGWPGAAAATVGKILYNSYKGRQWKLAVQRAADQGWNFQGMTAEQRAAAENIQGAGGLVSEDLRMTAHQRFRDAMRDLRNDPGVLSKLNDTGRVAWNGAMTILQKAMRPILDVAMYSKLYAHNQVVNERLANLPPDATPYDRMRVRNEAWSQADEVFGQVVWDRVNMPRWMKDVARLIIRSPGWTGGSVGTELRALTETIGTPYRLMRRTRPTTAAEGFLNAATGGENAIQGDVITPRMAQMMAFGIGTAIVNGAYQWVKTGKKPEDIKDLIYPRNGLTRPDGSEDRVRTIAYPAEWYSWIPGVGHPVDTALHKLAPIPNFLVNRIKGTDYFGNENPPFLEDLQQHFTPFFLRNLQQEKTSGGGTGSSIESVLGVTPAPAEMVRSAAMNKAIGYLRGPGGGGMTLEQLQQSRERRQTAQEAAAAPEGMHEHLQGEVEAGRMTPTEAKAMEKKAGQQPLVNYTSRLTLPQSLDVYSARSKQEDTPELKAAMQAKLTNTLKRAAPLKVPELLKSAGDAGLDLTVPRREMIANLQRKATKLLPDPDKATGTFKQQQAENQKILEEKRDARAALRQLGVSNQEARDSLLQSRQERQRLKTHAAVQ